MLHKRSRKHLCAVHSGDSRAAALSQLSWGQTCGLGWSGTVQSDMELGWPGTVQGSDMMLRWPDTVQGSDMWTAVAGHCPGGAHWGAGAPDCCFSLRVPGNSLAPFRELQFCCLCDVTMS